jgi:hypothetical protein
MESTKAFHYALHNRNREMNNWMNKNVISTSFAFTLQATHYNYQVYVYYSHPDFSFSIYTVDARRTNQKQLKTKEVEMPFP